METERMDCPDCGTAFQREDNYCRRCGMYLAAVQEALAPVPTQPVRRELDVVRSRGGGLPAPVKRMATAMVVGGALQVGLGIGRRYLAAQAGKKAASALTTPGGRVKAVQPAEPGDILPPEHTETISETLVIRRVWMRRG